MDKIAMQQMSYIGTTAPGSVFQIKEMVGVLRRTGITTHCHQTGLSISWKSWMGYPLKRPKRFVPKSQIVTFAGMASALGSMVILHINYQPGEADLPPLPEFLYQVWRELSHVSVGMQLNIDPWPDNLELDDLYNRIGGRPSRMILQVSPKEEELVTPSLLISRLVPFVSMYTDLLIDLSKGTGRELSPTQIEGFFNIILSLWVNFPDLRVGVAGGLGADNINQILPLVSLKGSLSTDAEGRIRDPNTDDFNLMKATNYISSVAQLFKPS